MYKRIFFCHFELEPNSSSIAFKFKIDLPKNLIGIKCCVIIRFDPATNGKDVEKRVDTQSKSVNKWIEGSVVISIIQKAYKLNNLLIATKKNHLWKTNDSCNTSRLCWMMLSDSFNLLTILIFDCGFISLLCTIYIHILNSNPKWGYSIVQTNNKNFRMPN